MVCCPVEFSLSRQQQLPSLLPRLPSVDRFQQLSRRSWKSFQRGFWTGIGWKKSDRKIPSLSPGSLQSRSEKHLLPSSLRKGVLIQLACVVAAWQLLKCLLRRSKDAKISKVFVFFDSARTIVPLESCGEFRSLWAQE